MPRSRRSIATPNEAAAKSATAASTGTRARRGSFADPTSASVARGGPTVFAPAPKANVNANVPHAKKIGSARSKTGDKENLNENASTPKKSSGGNDNPMMSPIPYYKVLEERGGGRNTSPRLTRSAMKKSQQTTAKNMEQLDALEDSYCGDDSDDESNTSENTGEYDSNFGMLLAYSPPTREHHERHMLKVRAEEEEKERLRDTKIRKAKEAGLNYMSSTPEKKQANRKKRAKKNHDQPQQPVSQFDGEQVRQIMSQALEQNNQHFGPVIERANKAAALERDASYLKQQNDELRETCHKLQETIRDFQMNVSANKQDMEEKMKLHDEQSRLQIEEIRVLKEEQAMMARELKKSKESEKLLVKEMDLLNEQNGELQANFKNLAKELEIANNALLDSSKVKEELEATKASEAGNSTRLQHQIDELKSTNSQLQTQLDKLKQSAANKESSLEQHIAQLIEESKASLQEAQHQQSKLAAENETIIQQLERDLEYANTKMEGMQSPRGMKVIEDKADELRETIGTLNRVLTEKNQEIELLQSNVEKLSSDMHESNEKAEEAQNTANGWESKACKLSNELEKTKKDLGCQLEEIAAENEELLSNLKSSQSELEHMAQEVQSKSAQLSSTSTEKQSLSIKLDQAQQDISSLHSKMNHVEEQLSQSKNELSTLQQDKKESDETVMTLSKEVQTLTNHLENAKKSVDSLNRSLEAKQTYVDQFESIERQLRQEMFVMHEIRRNLHNRVMQLSGNIRVFVRVRPLISDEVQQLQHHQASNSIIKRPSSSSSSSRPSSRGSQRNIADGSASSTDICPFHFPDITDRSTSSNATGSDEQKPSSSADDITKQVIEITEPFKDRGGLNPRRKKWKFGFDRVFDPSQAQGDIWDAAEPLVQSAVDGFAVCMFAYGQTGSGKTHTMIGDPEHPGLIPRAVEKLFSAKHEIERSSRQEILVSISVELLEVYNEEVRDLLDSRAGPSGQLINLKLNSNEAVGNILVTANNKEEFSAILDMAQKRRCVKATKSNAQSSRSHLLFTVHFEVSSTSREGANRKGCLHIVDLAGSERLDKSGSHGALLTEAKHINTSLSALALVIEKLQAKDNHIPFRNSKLTYLLRNSLGGDSKTLAIVCCSPHHVHFNESLNSVRFASKASKVELKEANQFSS